MSFRLSLRSFGTGAFLWLLPAFAYAQADTTTIQEGVAWVVTWIIAAMNLGIWIVFTLLTQLLDTSLFLDTNMTAILNEVWQLSRNLVNIIFAVVLIGAAVYTVVTANKEFVSTNLKKFVLAVILVNFSWFIPRVVIDVGNVAAATIFDIPSLLGATNAPCKYRSPTRISLFGTPNGAPACTLISTPPAPNQFECDCAAIIDARYFLNNDEAALLLPGEGWNRILGNTMFVRLVNMNHAQNLAPSSVILNGLIINHARLMGLASVPPSEQDTEIEALIMFLLQEAIVVLLHAALFFPLVAMLLAFAIRIPVLWFTIAFMPFTVLQYVLPEQIITEYPKKLMSNFISAAFLPAKVGIPLTIGFIMVNAGQQAQLLKPLQSISFKLTNNISDFWELLWLIMVLGIIWEGVFETLKGAGVMGKFSETIKSTGQGLGMMALKTPLNVPFIPVPGGGNTSLLKMGRTMRNAGQFDDINDAFNQLRNSDKDNMKNKARNLATSDPGLRTLDEDIRKLTEAIEQSKADPANEEHKQKVDTLKAKIANTTGLNASEVNGTSLERFLTEARSVPNALAPKLDELGRKIATLKTKE